MQYSDKNSTMPGVRLNYNDSENIENVDIGEDKLSKNWISRIGWIGWMFIGAFFIALKIILVMTEKPVEHLQGQTVTPNQSLGHALHEFFLHFSGELGVAIFVFAAVSVTIESFTRKRIEDEDRKRISKYDRKFEELIIKHQDDKKEIKTELFRSVFGIVVDDSVVGGVIDALFRESFFRTNLKVQYFFDCVEGNPNIVQCREVLKFRNHNKSNQPSILDIRYNSDNIYRCDQFSDRIVGVQVVGSNGKIVNKIVGDKENNKKNGISTFLIDQDEKLKIPVPPHDFVEVHFENITYRRFCDSLSFISVSAAEDLKVVLVDNTGKNLVFNIETAHKYDAVKEPHFDADVRQQKWHIQHAILPGNGVNISWYDNN